MQNPCSRTTGRFPFESAMVEIIEYLYTLEQVEERVKCVRMTIFALLYVYDFCCILVATVFSLSIAYLFKNIDK